MMSEKTVQELQVKKRELQSKLSALLSSKQCSKDDINEIKSEILHIDKLIEKKVGNKELKRQEEINRRKSGKDQAIFKAYSALKSKYKKISEMYVAVNRFVNTVDLKNYEKPNERVKVR